MPNACTFERILLDSGAYTQYKQGGVVDIEGYLDWVARFPHIDAFAGLDDIGGDYKRSLRNYEKGGFPTIHDQDPPELLDDLIPIARSAGGWIGIGCTPDDSGRRMGREDWLLRTLKRIPDDLHVHGFALRHYSYIPRFDSFDSTAWFRSAMRLRKIIGPWLMHDEAIELSIKQCMRSVRFPADPGEAEQEGLFDS